MTIYPSDILFLAGGSALRKFGAPSRRTAPYARGGEENKETFTRAAPNGYYLDRDGILRGATTDVPRFEYIDPLSSGTPDPYWLLEEARTNLVLWNRDLTNAAWTKTNVSAVKDQTGIDGVASSASRITASAGNGTCLQGITDGSKARYQTCYVKRLVGAGTINMTMDNGSTWTAITVTSAWTRVSIPTQTLANPTVGFRIVTNGDSIAVDYVQCENGTFQSSVIPTTTVSVTRAAESTTLPFLAGATSSLAIYARFVERGSVTTGGAVRRLLSIGQAGGTPQLNLHGAASNTYYSVGYTGALTSSISSLSATAAPTFGQLVELRALFDAGAGIVQLNQSINLAAEVAAAAGSSALPLDVGGWSGSALWVNTSSAGSGGYTAFDTLAIIRGAPTLTELRALRA
jgi:hypothetical protein